MIGPGPQALLLVLVLLVAGCASAETPEGGAQAAVRAQQEAMSAEALRALEGRTCADPHLPQPR